MTKPQGFRARASSRMLALLCAVTFPANALAVRFPADAPAQDVSPQQAAPIPADQLDSLVAPIALYPDPMLAQTLAASTYPLEIIQLQQWLARNPGLKDKALADAVAKQPWDPSVQAMAALPDVVKRLADDIQWATDLGNAFLAQKSDVMDAVQRMRRKAEGTGNLKSTPQQTVETKVVENKSVVVIEQASPEIVYVPSYDPTVVYGAPVYPYPAIAYPPPGYYAAGMAVSFGVGVAMGAAFSGGWGWGAGWGHGDVDVNFNNSFNRNANVNRNTNRGSSWQHQPQHRGGAPYRDRATADRFGGTARGDSLANRQAGARQQLSRQGGNVAGRPAGATGAQRGQPGGGAGSRAGGADLGSRTAGGRASGGGADRIGQRDISRASGGGRDSAFGGGGQRFNGSSARASSSRGASSMQSRGGASRGGGGSRGGGSRGGGRRR